MSSRANLDAAGAVTRSSLYSAAGLAICRVGGGWFGKGCVSTLILGILIFFIVKVN